MYNIYIVYLKKKKDLNITFTTNVVNTMVVLLKKCFEF